MGIWWWAIKNNYAFMSNYIIFLSFYLAEGGAWVCALHRSTFSGQSQTEMQNQNSI